MLCTGRTVEGAEEGSSGEEVDVKLEEEEDEVGS